MRRVERSKIHLAQNPVLYFYHVHEYLCARAVQCRCPRGRWSTGLVKLSFARLFAEERARFPPRRPFDRIIISHLHVYALCRATQMAATRMLTVPCLIFRYNKVPVGKGGGAPSPAINARKSSLPPLWFKQLAFPCVILTEKSRPPPTIYYAVFLHRLPAPLLIPFVREFCFWKGGMFNGGGREAIDVPRVRRFDVLSIKIVLTGTWNNARRS